MVSTASLIRNWIFEREPLPSEGLVREEVVAAAAVVAAGQTAQPHLWRLQLAVEALVAWRAPDTCGDCGGSVRYSKGRHGWCSEHVPDEVVEAWGAVRNARPRGLL